MKFSKLVEHVSKKPVPTHVTYFIAEVMVSDEEGEDVEVFSFTSVMPSLLNLVFQVPYVVVRR